MGGRAADLLSCRPRLQRQRLVGQLGLVHMQWEAYGVALLVREIHLRASARARLPDPGSWPGLDLGRRTTPARTAGNRFAVVRV
jgi:hypothetical protein